MATLTYVKGLPAPIDELNAMGSTKFSMFLHDYSQIFYVAACETVNHLLNTEKFNKSKWNTHLQEAYGISKRVIEEFKPYLSILPTVVRSD